MPLLKHFTLDQFDCKCCGKNWMKIPHIQKLDTLQDLHPHKISILSGYRCYEWNKKVGGVPTSRHCQGDASDLHSEDMDGLFELCNKMWDAVGDGRNRGFIHVDDRKDKKRAWTY